MKYEGLSCISSDKIPERLLTQEQVAQILGVSPKTLEYWRWKGGGPKFIKLGKLARYRERDVHAFIEQLANCPD